MKFSCNSLICMEDKNSATYSEKTKNKKQIRRYAKYGKGDVPKKIFWDG